MSSRSMMSYVVFPFVPSLRLELRPTGELLRFSRGMLGLAFLNLLFARADIFVLSKLYPASAIGLYVMAVYLVQTPTSFLINLLGQTLLPTLSKVSQDNERLLRNHLLATKGLLLLGFPIVVFIAFYGRSILTLLYGKPYRAAASVLTVAALVSVMNVVNSQITLVLYAKGRPESHRRCLLVMALLMAVLIYPLGRLTGPLGGQLAALGAIVIGYSFQVARLRQLIGLQVAEVARLYFVPVVAALATAISCSWGLDPTDSVRPLIGVIFGAIGVLISYCLGAALLLRKTAELADLS